MLAWLRRRLTGRERTVPPPPPPRPLVDPLEILLTEVLSEWQQRRYPPIAKSFERSGVYSSSAGVWSIGSVHVDVGTLGRRDDYDWLDVGYGFVVADTSPVLDPERCAESLWTCFSYGTGAVLLVSHVPVSEESFAAVLEHEEYVEMPPVKPTESPVWIVTVNLPDVVLFVVVDISAARGPEECRGLFEVARDLCAQHFDDPHWESLGVAHGGA